MFSIGGCVLGRLREEMADPTLRERKLSPKNPSHTFTDEDKERQKAANSDIESSARGWVYLRRKRFFTDEG